MIKKEIFIGFLVGILATCAGLFLYVTALSDYSFLKTLELARDEDRLGHLLSLGAILNFLPFFVFLKKKQVYRSRGVLIATLLVAIAIIFITIDTF
ncbi:hypothetical protein [Mesonia aquimarina]|uniref:hypothetical protein n=1 Tax=Mesonia aquimarina TaxID=1504967 RepID=UPI000EF5DD1E|nr:hypothetical protein [Mesonia aquimarina]